MKSLANFLGVALVGAFTLLAPPTARAQVGVNINIGVPAWGPPVPYGTQYYYIPEIDGYYDLYSQQYIVFQDGYWVPLPQLYGYDPYQFHPVIVDYRGPQPWLRLDDYHRRYAYQPYRTYGPSRAGYYNGGYGYGPSYGRPRYDARSYPNGRGYEGRDRDFRGQYPGGGHGAPPSDPRPPQPGGYPQPGGPRRVPSGNGGGWGGQGQPNGHNEGGRGDGGHQGGHARTRG